MPNAPIPSTTEERTLRLHAEGIQVTREPRETGSVSVSITTHTREHPVDQVLTSTRVEVRHVAVDRIVDQPPPSREEGDTLIIPVVEEVVVTRFLIREEIHITRTSETRRHRDSVSLRVEQATVTRSAATAGPPSSNIQHEASKEADHGK